MVLAQRRDAFGNALSRAGAFPTDRCYRGDRRDQLTGLMDFRARLYDPLTNRFTAIDPFGGNMSDPLQWMRYGHAVANPVWCMDPSGMMSLGMGIGVSIGIGMAFGATSTALYNHSVGNRWNEGLLENTLIDGAMGLGVFLVPALAIPLSIYGIAFGSAVAIGTWTDRTATWDQKLAASALFLIIAG